VSIAAVPIALICARRRPCRYAPAGGQVGLRGAGVIDSRLFIRARLPSARLLVSRWLRVVSARRQAGYAAPVTALWEMDAITLAGMLRRREVSAREVIAAHIARIEAVDAAVNAVVTRCFEQATAKAAAADQALARGAPTGLLHGLPVAHKDLVDTAGVRTTYGSPLFAEHVPDRDELLVSRMAGAGAISLGKTNTPEFGAGSHTELRCSAPPATPTT
jgi:Amidase